MIAPRVHMNGTAKSDLLKAIEEASHALTFARSKLRETCPHGRDYYVIGDNAYTQALNEYVARMEKLLTVNDEIIAMYGAIAKNEINF